MPALIAQPGMPLWIDLATTDLAGAKSFYEAVFGWEFDQATEGYAVAKKEGMPVAGLAQIPEGNISLWGLMLYTPNVADAHRKAMAAGAESALDPQEMNDGSNMAILVDPSGATIGLKKPADEVALLAAGEPATPVWHELVVGHHWEETLEFYHELAGWDIRAGEAEDGFRYAIGEFEGSALVGMWAADEARSMWTLYLGVGEMGPTLEAATQHGGDIVRQPWKSEFGYMASITDPQGALVNLCEVEEYVPQEDDVHEPDLFAE